MAFEPAGHGIFKGALEIEGGLVAGDPSLPEAHEHCADVLMFVFDGTARTSDSTLQQTVVFGLAVGSAGKIVCEHGKIVRDDRVVLLVGPIVAGHRGWFNRLLLSCHGAESYSY